MNTIDTLLAMGVMPIVNENDTLSFKEIMFGDNDNLSALIAQIGNADLLVLLSDVEGLYEKDPKHYPGAAMISDGQEDRRAHRGLCPRDDERKERRRHDEQAGGSEEGGELRHTHQAGGGRREGCRAKGDRRRGDRHPLCGTKRLTRKKCWIAFAFKPKGRIGIDRGRAGRAPPQREKSPAFRHRRGGG